MMKNKVKQSLLFQIIEAATCQCCLLAVVLASIYRIKYGPL